MKRFLASIAVSTCLLVSTLAGTAMADWEITTVDGDGTNVGRYVSMKLDPSGNPCVAYQDFTGGALGKLKYAKFNGSAWNITQVSNASYGNYLGHYSSLALDASGNPSIACWGNAHVQPFYIKGRNK